MDAKFGCVGASGQPADRVSALLLYDSRVSGNCYKVRLLLAHLDVEYERCEVDVVDRHLSERRFHVGEHCTAADIALCAYTQVAGEGGFDLSGYPAVGA
jgi:glutathione S-transferase